MQVGGSCREAGTWGVAVVVGKPVASWPINFGHGTFARATIFCNKCDTLQRLQKFCGKPRPLPLPPPPSCTAAAHLLRVAVCGAYKCQVHDGADTACISIITQYPWLPARVAPALVSWFMRSRKLHPHPKRNFRSIAFHCTVWPEITISAKCAHFWALVRAAIEYEIRKGSSKLHWNLSESNI